MTQAVVAVGSNTGHESNICEAFDALCVLFEPLQISPVYQSQADENAMYYYNLVINFEIQLPVEKLRKELKGIEDCQGRVKGSHLGVWI